LYEPCVFKSRKPNSFYLKFSVSMRNYYLDHAPNSH
jgi:hypothetical protein